MKARTQRKKRFGSPSARLLLSLFLAVGICVFMLAAQGFNDRVFPADAALVLGEGGGTRHGIISPSMRAKADTAYGLYYYGTVKKIIIGVGDGNLGGGPEETLRDYLVRHGVAPEDVIVNPGEADIRSTARFTAEYTRERDWQRVIVVGQFFHLPRAVLSLKHEGVPIVGSLHASHFGPLDLFYLLREIPAYFAYWSETK